jgi:2OG-Fe(II) oxygenase superfamily
MIELSTATCRAYRDPCPFLRFTDFFERGAARKLAREFPPALFQESVGRDERYRLSERTIVEEGVDASISDLSQSWQELVGWFVSPGYRALVQGLTGAQLDGTRLKVRLYRYSRRDWMRPHSDPPDRITTQLIYLTENWQPRWGGHLNLMRSTSPDDIACSFAPEFNSSLMFGGRSRPIHSVSRVGPDAGVDRCLIIAQFVQ